MENALWVRQRQLYSSIKTYRTPDHPAVILALEQYNKVLAVSSAIDRQVARLMEKAWHLEERQKMEKLKDAKVSAEHRRRCGIF